MPGGRRAWVWTEDKRRAVQADVQPGRTAADLAQRHGLTPKAVERALADGKVTRLSSEAAIERQCLRCRKAFMAGGPFIRVCGSCKDKASAVQETVLGWMG